MNNDKAQYVEFQGFYKNKCVHWFSDNGSKFKSSKIPQGQKIE